MCNIYRQAYITLYAYTSKEGLGTCPPFYDRNLIDHACQVSPGFYILEDDYTFSDPYELEGKAQTRGWILQEEQLSPRRLHFGEHHPVWRCGEMSSRHDRPFAFSGEGFYNTMASAQLGQELQFVSWRRMVEEYTGRDLTFATDKLPAISGLAYHFSQYCTSRAINYLTGIWREDLLNSLLWRRRPTSPNIHKQDHVKQETEFVAPSWSWASQEGPICFEHEDTDVNSGI